MKRLCTTRAMRRGAIAALLCAPTVGAQPSAPEPPPPLDPWYEALDFCLFADSYASVNFNLPKPQEGTNRFRAYDRTNAMSVSWVGLDVSHAAEPVGGGLGLRVGPAAHAYAASCLSENTRCDSDVDGLGLVKQAYAAWKPGGAGSNVTLDFGKFDTIYGAEVAESQDNFSYTRGALYWLGQPLFHVGLRTRYDPLPELALTALVVNGWNNTIDNNLGKSFGLQLTMAPADRLRVALGWLGGPEQDDIGYVACEVGTEYDPTTGGCSAAADAELPARTYVVDRGGANRLQAWRHLIDLSASYVPIGNLGLVLNADFGTHGHRSIGPDLETELERQYYFGAMLGARLALTETYALAGRGEYYSDPDGMTTDVAGLQLVTGTLTAEATPTDFLILRLEGRGDFVVDADGSKEIFQYQERGHKSRLITTTLGVVVTTN